MNLSFSQRSLVDSDDSIPESHLSSTILPSQSSKISVKVMATCVMIQSISLGLIFPSIWFLLKKEDHGTVILGVLSSIFACGHVLFSPFSRIYAKLFSHESRGLILFCLVFSIAGNLLYFFYSKFDDNIVYYLGLSRFLSGIGNGSISISRIYITSFYVYRKKIKPLYLLSFSQVLGFTIGSGICWALTDVSFNMFGVDVDQYSAPALVSIIFFLINVVILYIFPLEPIPPVHEDDSHFDISNEQKTGEILCIIIWYCSFGLYSVFEYLTPRISDLEFNWGLEENCILFFSTGLMACPIFAYFYKKGRKKFHPEKILIVCMFGLLATTAFMYIWPNEHDLTQTQFIIAWSLFVILWPVSVSQNYISYSNIVPFAYRSPRIFWFGFTAIFARTVTPIWSSFLYVERDRSEVWLLLSGHILVSLICSFLLSRKIKIIRSEEKNKRISRQIQIQLDQQEQQQRLLEEREKEEQGFLKVHQDVATHSRLINPIHG